MLIMKVNGSKIVQYFLAGTCMSNTVLLLQVTVIAQVTGRAFHIKTYSTLHFLVFSQVF